MTDPRPTITVHQYRARDIRPGDVILVPFKCGEVIDPSAVWAEVIDTVTGALDAEERADENLTAYKHNRHPSIGLSNFVRERGRLTRLNHGHTLLIQAAVTGEPGNARDWHEFRNLDLVDVQREHYPS